MPRGGARCAQSFEHLDGFRTVSSAQRPQQPWTDPKLVVSRKKKHLFLAGISPHLDRCRCFNLLAFLQLSSLSHSLKRSTEASTGRPFMYGGFIWYIHRECSSLPFLLVQEKHVLGGLFCLLANQSPLHVHPVVGFFKATIKHHHVLLARKFPSSGPAVGVLPLGHTHDILNK